MGSAYSRFPRRHLQHCEPPIKQFSLRIGLAYARMLWKWLGYMLLISPGVPNTEPNRHQMHPQKGKGDQVHAP